VPDVFNGLKNVVLQELPKLLMKYLLLCLFLSLTTDMLFAQTDLSDYHCRHYTSENGLSQNTVKAIAPDDYGFIWLATESGLLRFDGNNFKPFDKNNTGIVSSRMFDIRRSADGQKLLAISSIGEFLAISKGKAYKLSGENPDVLVTGSSRKLNAKAFKWVRGQAQPDKLFFYPGNHLGALVVMKYGILWYRDQKQPDSIHIPQLDASGEMFSFDNAMYRIIKNATRDSLQRITPEGIRNVHFEGDFTRQQQPADYYVESAYATGQTFLFTAHNIYLATPAPNGNIATRLLLSGFEFDQLLIRCAYYDSIQQRLFLGSLTNGLYILSRKKFHTVVYNDKKKRPDINVVYDQVALNDSTVLTGNGTRCCSNPAIPAVYRGFPDDGGTTHRSDALLRLSSGDILVCGIDRIFLLDSQAIRKKKEWTFTQPTTLTEGKDHRIWIGTERQGLFVMDPKMPQMAPRRVLAMKDYIMSLEAEGDKWLWICSERHLLCMHLGTGAVDTIQALNNKMARSLYIPRPGEVWICTYEDGLFLWLKGKLVHFPMASYPYMKAIHKILEDSQGNFWISTNHGIYQGRRKDLLAYALDEQQEEPYLFYYGKEAGFLTNEFNGGSPYVGTKLRNGFFTFSSMEGVVFFEPSKIKPELPAETFIIDKLELDDREIKMENGLAKLHRTFRTFKITPASAYLGDPGNLQYQFRINNDSNWNNTYNGVVILSSLPIGHNHIVIRKKAGFGAGNYITRELTVYMPPAWWQTQWFYISACILLLAFIWLIIRLRVLHWKKRNLLLEAAILHRTQDLKDIIHDLEHSENRLGEQLQFQTKLNEHITHDITTPLKYLSMFTGQSLNRADHQLGVPASDMRHVHQDVNRIYEVVQNLGEYMRTRLSKNFSSTSFHLHKLIAQKTALFKIAATARNNAIENLTDPALLIHHNESLISIIIHNLIDNAVKNTENGKITITTTVENDRILLSIADTGKGMTAEQLQACNDYFNASQVNRSIINTGFGFQIIKEIAVSHRLKVRVSAALEKGINITVSIPQK